MKRSIANITGRYDLSRQGIIELLGCQGEDKKQLFADSGAVRNIISGNRVWFRGLIEFSNICDKNCLYCGIRKGNKSVKRYNLKDDEILESARFAYKNRWGSVVLQSGEIESTTHTTRITNLIRQIKEISDGKLGITISLGEQEPDVYADWFEAGAHRYLLRIESSNRVLYSKIHPNDSLHNFDRRIDCLKTLKEIGYQTGTGVMIGLPHQTAGDLADDLLLMKDLDIDMCGMGPYVVHSDTPLAGSKALLKPPGWRFDTTLKMIAILRLLMVDINIAAATALQAIDAVGREKAVKAGANVIMPNITPGRYRDSYNLYENKPCTDESADDCSVCLEARLSMVDAEIGYDEWGDSKHYFKRKKG